MDSRPRFHGDDILRGNDRGGGARGESRRTGEQVNRRKKEQGGRWAGEVSRRKNRDGRGGGRGGRITGHVEAEESSEAGVALRARVEQGSR